MNADQRKTNSNKQVKEDYWDDIKDASKKCAHVEGGIVKIVDGQTSNSGLSSIQAGHNANHALTFITYAIHRILEDKKIAHFEEWKALIIEHLSCLREFVAEDEVPLSLAIAQLLSGVKDEKLTKAGDWTRFILKYWKEMRIIAEKYSYPERCFPKSEYQKLSDIVMKRHYFRSWWWQVLKEKNKKELRKFFKNLRDKYKNKFRH